MNSNGFYAPDRPFTSREKAFECAQKRLNDFIAGTYSILVYDIPLLDILRRNIIECAEDFFLAKTWSETIGSEGSIDVTESDRIALNSRVLSQSLRRLFPEYDESHLTKAIPNIGQPYKKGGSAIVLLDYDRTYSASLQNVIRRLAGKSHSMMRIRYPYDLLDSMDESPIEGLIPDHIWVAALLENKQQHVNTRGIKLAYEIAAFVAGQLKPKTPNGYLTRTILTRIVQSRNHYYAVTLDVIADELFRRLRPRLLVTADDTWPQGRSVIRRANCPTVKFQDGLLVKHRGLEDTICNTWCIWSDIEKNYLLQSGVSDDVLVLCRSRSLVWKAIPEESRVDPSVAGTIVYASRPDSRDLSSQEKYAILRDLIDIAHKHPELKIVNKLHPSEENSHVGDIQRNSPENFSIVSGHIPFEAVIRDAALLIAGVSLTLYQSTGIGIPAAIITYGPRPNIGLFPHGIYPILDTPEELERACMAPKRIKQKYFKKQRDFIRLLRQQGNLSPGEVIEGVLVGNSQND